MLRGRPLVCRPRVDSQIHMKLGTALREGKQLCQQWAWRGPRDSRCMANARYACTPHYVLSVSFCPQLFSPRSYSLLLLPSPLWLCVLSLPLLFPLTSLSPLLLLFPPPLSSPPSSPLPPPPPPPSPPWFPLRVTTPGDVVNAGDITKVPNRIKDANLPSDSGTTLGTTSFSRVMSISGDPRDIQMGRKLIF